jgi:hypothetical protein
MKSFTILRNKLLKIFGHLKLSKYPPYLYYKPIGYKVRGGNVEELLKSIIPGDIIIRGYDDYLSSRLIGKWSHVGLVTKENEIIHAIGSGVQREHIINFFRCDRIIIMRPKLTVDQIKRVITKAESSLGVKYDFAFNFDNEDEFSCTELLYYCFEEYKDILKMSKEEMSLFAGLIKKVVINPKAFKDFEGFDEITRVENNI